MAINNSAGATALDASDKTVPGEKTDKRDFLIAAEKKYQIEWAESKIFNHDAPTKGECQSDSFFGTMAYPYMNGTLHAGHAFTASKIEFATGFARMRGKRALFPQGFHCTGMPIKAAADKLVREIEMFGTNFERFVDEEAPRMDELSLDSSETTTDSGKFRSTKSKAVAKTGSMKYQFQIMTSLGFPLAEIYKFADPAHWLVTFPPICKQDLSDFGGRIDWRRSMVTTDANPFYDQFVRWSMNKLREKMRFGKRYTIYSPIDGQACLDHDRSSGEGIAVQEYVCVKLTVLEWADKAKALMASKLPADATVFFVPATLRPETMYGQTCCFVGPALDYVVFRVSEKKYLVASPRAARNMAYQGIGEWGFVDEVARVRGSDLVGSLVHAPLSVHTNIRILPMETVQPNKGTGIVTCVPSDSPDDYATTLALQKKPDYYGIDAAWVANEILPIIKTPRGDVIAKTLYEEMKIQGPKDAKKLAEAKEMAYKEGFHQGTMIHGAFAGKTVVEARPLCEKMLMEQNEGFKYAEPDGVVTSRSGDDCVAAFLDQWYFAYGQDGDGEWYQQVQQYVDKVLECYYPEAARAFLQTVEWLGSWACTRSFGLGTRLPWDETQLVESLSDSTVYMAYYTVCHILHADIFGKTPGASSRPISPVQMTDDVWDYVFHRTNTVPRTGIADQDLERMRREFAYWYPLDVRVSGKDLINNHLTFCLYHHVALFPRRFWPKSFRVNGHLMLNSQKMSKSTGNFLTLRQALRKYGADATRIALADAGDGIEDANFDENVANASILRLFELHKWAQDSLLAPNREGERNFFDKLFDNDLNVLVRETRQNYEQTKYKLALKSGFFDLLLARDAYREQCKATGTPMHAELVRRYIELQALLLTPLAPHWAELIWREVLRKDSSVQNARYPEAASPDKDLLATQDYIKSTTSAIFQAEGKVLKKTQKGKQSSFDPTRPVRFTIFVAKDFPAWQNEYRKALRQHLGRSHQGPVDLKPITAKVAKADLKKVMPFLQELKKRIDGGEDAERVLARPKLSFDEVEVIRHMAPILKKSLRKVEGVDIVRIHGDGRLDRLVDPNGTDSASVSNVDPPHEATPGEPSFVFANVA